MNHSTAPGNRTVLISGGSIAGPAFAFWLARHGFRPTIVERGAAPRPGGQAVDLRGASRKAVERMNLLDQIKAVRLKERGMAYVDDRDRRRAEIDVDMFDGAGPVADIEILRGDLAEILINASVPDTEYVYDDTITSMTEHEGGVTVTFERTETREFDLVVGADGLHSTVRRLQFGPEEQFVRPLGSYTSFFTVPLPDDLDGWALMHAIPGGRLAMLRPDRDPHEAKAILSFRSEPFAYDRRDIEAQKKIIRDRFTDTGWRMPEILQALDTSEDFFFEAIAQVKMQSWSRGRVVLLGDAAYCGSPLSGHGTAMALVGAYILAGELALADGDHEVAFARYADEMREHVKAGQQLPPGSIKLMSPMTRPGIWLRDLYADLMTKWPLRMITAKMMPAGDEMELKEYQTAGGADNMRRRAPERPAPRC